LDESTDLLSGGDSEAITLWNYISGESVQSFERISGQVRCVVALDSGKRFVAASMEELVVSWDRKTGKQSQIYSGSDHVCSATAFSPDGKLLAIGLWGGAIELRDIATGKRVQYLKGHQMHAIAVAFSSDQKMILSGGTDGTLYLWNVTTGEKLAEGFYRAEKKKAPSDEGEVPAAIHAVAFSHDNKRIAFGGNGKTVVLWSLPETLMNP